MPALAARPAAAGDDDVAPLVAEIREERIREHVAFLADDRLGGRLGGSAQEARAADYIARRFQEYGLAPAFGTEYVQELPLLDLLVAHALALEVPNGARLELEDGIVPLACSAVGDLALDAEAVLVDDSDPGGAAPLDLAGKVALLRLAAPGDLAARALRAQEGGARAVIFLDSAPPTRLPGGVTDPDELAFDRSASRGLRVAVRTIEGLLGTSKTGGMDIFVALKTRETADPRSPDGRRLGPWDLRRRIAVPVALAHAAAFDGAAPGAPAPRVRLTGRLRRERLISRNVAGILPATVEVGRDAPVLVVGAHFDHVGFAAPAGTAARKPGEKLDFVYNGADDNASGTSALLELARAHATAPGPRPRPIVFVAFGAEEYGLVGSKHYAREPAIPLERTVGMLNLDMVGRNPDGPVTVAGAGSAPGLEALVRRANGAPGRPDVATLALRFDDGHIGRSDQMSFIERSVPALFLSTGEHEDYHEPSDEARSLSIERVGAVARLGAAILHEWARVEPMPGFQAPYLAKLRGRGASEGGEDEGEGD